MDPAQQRRTELLARLDALQQQVATLRQELPTLRSAFPQNNQLQSAAVSVAIQTSVSERHEPVLPDPRRFSGDACGFHIWLPSIKAKLRIDGDAIGDDYAKFYYVYINLDSSVQAMLLPQVQASEGAKEWDYNTLLTQLERIYR